MASKGFIPGILQRTRSAFARIRRDLRGESAALFAAAVLPTIAATGTAIDITRAYYAKSLLQAAVDSATIAGAKYFYDSSRNDEINRYFNANFPDGTLGIDQPDLAITPTEIPDRDGTREQKLTITANATVPNMFMHIFGLDHVDISAYSEAARRETGLEVVLALDNTGSMASDDAGDGQTRIEALREAANALIDILYGATPANQTNANLRVGIVPYSHSVNVGKLIHDRNDAANSPVLIPAQLQDYVDRGYDTPTDGAGWKGCITERPTVNNLAWDPDDTTIPATAYDIIDSAGAGAQRWQPYVAPSFWVKTVSKKGKVSYSSANAYKQPNAWAAAWPHTSDMPRTVYVVDGNGALVAETKNPDGGWSNNYGLTRGPNYSCVNEAIVASTGNTRETLKNYIDTKLITSGYTYTDLGAMWAYRMLSPGAPLASSVNWYDPLVEKAMIVMTDGEITGGTQSIAGGNIGYTSYGATFESRVWTSVNESKWAESHEQRLALICEEAKAPTSNDLPDKIKVYTITLAFNDDVAEEKRPLYENCATVAQNYYNTPTGDDLQAAFESIALDLAKLRLTQ